MTERSVVMERQAFDVKGMLEMAMLTKEMVMKTTMMTSIKI